MSKHTPGPWTAFIGGRGRTIAIDIGPTPIGKKPCIIDWPGFDGSDLPLMQRVANAHLIAAAPDLLEALKEITSDYADRFDLDDPSTNPGIKSSIKQARAAIAKAERGSK
jgi:hypothetical protein